MEKLYLRIELASDATFGRGDGVAGILDDEVQHDVFGCPYLAGRTLKGLLHEECVNLLFALEHGPAGNSFDDAARLLFGAPGSRNADRGMLQLGDAVLPKELRRAVQREIAKSPAAWTRQEVLESLTTIRRQTALDPATGAPSKETLRTMRVILQGTIFASELTLKDVGATEGSRVHGLLAACVKALRRAGSGRNRGRGEIRATLHDEQGRDLTDEWFWAFAEEVRTCLPASLT